jgi:hypothetical protein
VSPPAPVLFGAVPAVVRPAVAQAAPARMWSICILAGNPVVASVEPGQLPPTARFASRNSDPGGAPQSRGDTVPRRPVTLCQDGARPCAVASAPRCHSCPSGALRTRGRGPGRPVGGSSPGRHRRMEPIMISATRRRISSMSRRVVTMTAIEPDAPPIEIVLLCRHRGQEAEPTLRELSPSSRTRSEIEANASDPQIGFVLRK